MAAAHAQERAQTVQRSHPARQAGSAPRHPDTQRKELGRFSFLSTHPGERTVAVSPSLSLIPPLLPSLSGCQEPRGSRRGEEMPGGRSSPQPLRR